MVEGIHVDRKAFYLLKGVQVNRKASYQVEGVQVDRKVLLSGGGCLR
jgi:hypothetical protein